MTKSITKDLTVPLENGLTIQSEEYDCMKSVNEICKEFDISRKTLFYYDKIGLLKPSARIGTQNTKYYSEKKCKQLKEIISYKQAGIQLNTIKMLLNSTKEEKLTILEENIQSLEEIIHTQRSQIQKTKELIHELKERKK